MAYPKSYKLVWKNTFGKLAAGGFPTPESADYYRQVNYPDFSGSRACDIEPAFFDEVYRDEKGDIVKEIGNVRIS